MTLSCPSCGSTNISVTKSPRTFSAPMGPAMPIEFETDTCNECGESGDFEKHNDEVIRDAEQRSAAASVESLFEMIAGHGCSMAYMERSLALPPRTLARWKAGGTSASGLALLRIVATYPWVLEVADARFSSRAASSKLIMEAGKTIGGIVQRDSGRAGDPQRDDVGRDAVVPPLRVPEDAEAEAGLLANGAQEPRRT